MKLPRDIGGKEYATRLRHYGYQITRQTGSHLRLTSTAQGSKHHVTIPAHRKLKVSTLSDILTDVASYLKMDRAKLAQELFE